MPDIQKDLVHTVDPSRCGNCKQPVAAHVDGICLFDSTTFRAENVNDHEDCICERIIEEDPTDVKGGKVMLKITDKKPLSYFSQTFTV